MAYRSEHVEFTFDLRRALVVQEVGEKGPVSTQEAKSETRLICLSNIAWIALLVTASQRDAYFTLLRAINITSMINLVNMLDVLMRFILFIFFASYAAAFYAQGWVDINLGSASTAYFVVFCMSICLFLGERLAGRYGNMYEVYKDWFVYAEALLPAVLGRTKFAGPISAFVITSVYIAVAAGMCVVMLSALTILSAESDAPAVALICMTFATESIYTLARLGTFKTITEQSWTATYVASLHTFFTTTISVPTSVVYIYVLVSRFV